MISPRTRRSAGPSRRRAPAGSSRGWGKASPWSHSHGPQCSSCLALRQHRRGLACPLVLELPHSRDQLPLQRLQLPCMLAGLRTAPPPHTRQSRLQVRVKIMGSITIRTDGDFPTILHFCDPIISTRTRRLRPARVRADQKFLLLVVRAVRCRSHFEKTF
jgi:hypothetical protein